MPSEFAAYLTELRQIQRYRPHFNHPVNRTRRAVFIKVSGGPAPRITAGRDRRAGRRALLRAVPLLRPHARGGAHAERPARPPRLRRDDADGVRRPGRPVRPAAAGRRACATSSASAAGPAPGSWRSGTTASASRPAMAFLEGRTIQPIDRVVRAMQDAAADARFELAARWREKFEQLEWLLGATSRARTAVDLLTFVYRDPGRLRRRPGLPHPAGRGAGRRFPTPPRRSSTRPFARWWRTSWPGRTPPAGPLPLESIDEILLLMAWFRAHPEALRRTTPYTHWLNQCACARERADTHPAHRRRRVRRRPARRAHRAGRRRGHRPAAHARLRRRPPLRHRRLAGVGHRHLVGRGRGLRARGLHQHPHRHAAGGRHDARAPWPARRSRTGSRRRRSRSSSASCCSSPPISPRGPHRSTWSTGRPTRSPPGCGSTAPIRRRRAQRALPRPAGAARLRPDVRAPAMLSGLLGIGSGALKVLAMDQAMRLPFKVSTTTSNFMIGVTAAASAGIYLAGATSTRAGDAGRARRPGRRAARTPRLLAGAPRPAAPAPVHRDHRHPRLRDALQGHRTGAL